MLPDPFDHLLLRVRREQPAQLFPTALFQDALDDDPLMSHEVDR
jgi:hypothetical protein